MAEHKVCLGHCIQHQDTSMLSTNSGHMNHTIEIELLPNSMSRDDGFCLSNLWEPLLSEGMQGVSLIGLL
jgi:hypothetical protein